ncbi:MAG TPA: PAS domain-containing sensor histidine kinase [Gaiellaceae bacterium]|nr:PAS domain-containing sensor histidine kinase [Gaiellaceae bacterium]
MSERAERRYQRLAEQLPGVVYTEGLQAASAMYISPRIEHLTGYSAEEWTADDNFFERVLHPDDRDRVRKAFADARERREAIVCEYRIVRPDGTCVWVNDDAGIAFDDDGAPLYIQGYMADVTERKATEASLDAEHARVLELEREQNERLRELDVMKDEFVALVSHELRTPLTAIQGYTELVLDGTAGEINDEQRSMLTAVDRSSARLFRLINDLLFVAQVNAGTLDVAIEDVDLAAVAREAVADARPRAAAAEVTLDFEFDLTPTVRADRVRLGQVFDNLISNAIKFTPPGGRVGLTISMVGEEAIVVVTDSGMGMSTADQQRLFTRFFRTKAAAKIQGTGLGLSITKAILDAHHGSISVESELGTGTSFTFTVPTADLSSSA